jgi:hypothetical protein
MKRAATKKMSRVKVSRFRWLNATRAAGSRAMLVAAFVPLLSIGCMSVTLYQPQKAIHRPVVVENAPDNFDGLRILVRCVSHREFLPTSDASKLCANLSQEFLRQGADSQFVVPVGANWIEPEVFDGETPDLIVELQSRIDHSYKNPITHAASIMTLTLVPYITEQSFSQRVVVFGKDRSVLAEEVFKERFVQYNGCGVWSLNYILDWFFRDDDQDLMGKSGQKDFTRDFYGQVRQMTFNARIRSEILGLTGVPSSKGASSPNLETDTGSDDTDGETDAAPNAASGVSNQDDATTDPSNLPGLSEESNAVQDSLPKEAD